MVSEEFLPNKTYVNGLRRKYNAQVIQEDFSDTSSIGEINAIIKEATYGKFEEALGEIDRDTKLVLVNTVYFKADWLSKFEKKDTKEKTFTNIDGSESTIPFLSKNIALK